MKTYDAIIIGGGPAGLTAALYLGRNALKTAVISADIGGTTNSIPELENWPGFKGSGPELMQQMYKQVKEYNIDFIMRSAKNISRLKEGFVVITEKEEIRTKALIVATGTERKKLNLPDEVKFIGKGISYCATCDGFFFKNKKVCVIGGSDCAAIAALSLAGIAKSVDIFYRGTKLRCEAITLQRLSDKKNVKIHYNSFPKKIIGKDFVEGIEIEEKGKKKTYNLDGIFIEIGSLPITELLKKLNVKLDEEKQVIIDDNMNTSVMGVFAAGDVTNQKLKQVIVAAGQGAIAAKAAYDYLARTGKI
jgi:thioredoxin-disulfide reductase